MEKLSLDCPVFNPRTQILGQQKPMEFMICFRVNPILMFYSQIASVTTETILVFDKQFCFFIIKFQDVFWNLWVSTGYDTRPKSLHHLRS